MGQGIKNGKSNLFPLPYTSDIEKEFLFLNKPLCRKVLKLRG